MPTHEIDEQLRKPAPASSRAADLGWVFYLSGEGKERQAAAELVDVLLFQDVQKDYREKIILDPPPAQDCGGEHALGTVLPAWKTLRPVRPTSARVDQAHAHHRHDRDGQDEPRVPDPARARLFVQIDNLFNMLPSHYFRLDSLRPDDTILPIHSIIMIPS